MSMPKEIREHLARAKAHLDANDIVRTLECVSLAISSITSLQHIPSHSEIDRKINALLREITHHPIISSLLQHQSNQKVSAFSYQRGKEKVLAAVLQEFAKMLQTHNKDDVAVDKALADKRLQELIGKARAAFTKGEWGIGTSFLQRAAAEFDYDERILGHIGTVLAKFKQYSAAGKVFRQGIKCNPKNLENYTQAINNFILSEEYANAEQIFSLALRQFGGHPRTYGRMATLYLLWEKHDKALEFANMSLELDPEEKYALEVLKALEQ